MNRSELGDRILAMFALSATGDALGAPVEIWSRKKIRERYGRLTNFVAEPNHKFGPIKAGETTDDTQLTLAIARSIVRSGCVDLDDIAREHVLELKRTTRGWGGSTTEAVKRLANGEHWSRTGSHPSGPENLRGKGNGVAMKISPLGVYYAVMGIDPLSDSHSEITQQVAMMTHATRMGIASGFAQVAVIHFLLTQPMSQDRFTSVVFGAAGKGQRCFLEQDLPNNCDEAKLTNRFTILSKVTPMWSDQDIRCVFGTGACYVYESLPLAYALFLRKPNSIEALYDAVNFGGDTDTVAAITGALLGAHNGMSIVPSDLWARVDRHDEITDLAAKFNTLLGLQ